MSAVLDRSGISDLDEDVLAGRRQVVEVVLAIALGVLHVVIVNAGGVPLTVLSTLVALGATSIFCSWSPWSLHRS